MERIMDGEKLAFEDIVRINGDKIEFKNVNAKPKNAWTRLFLDSQNNSKSKQRNEDVCYDFLCSTAELGNTLSSSGNLINGYGTIEPTHLTGAVLLLFAQAVRTIGTTNASRIDPVCLEKFNDLGYTELMYNGLRDTVNIIRENNSPYKTIGELKGFFNKAVYVDNSGRTAPPPPPAPVKK